MRVRRAMDVSHQSLFLARIVIHALQESIFLAVEGSSGGCADGEVLGSAVETHWIRPMRVQTKVRIMRVFHSENFADSPVLAIFRTVSILNSK